VNQEPGQTGAGNDFLNVDTVRDALEVIGLSLEVFGAVIITAGILAAAIRFLRSEKQHPGRSAYYSFRRNIALSLLLGLEVLIAADVIRSVSVSESIESLGILAIVVLIRTFLAWTLTVEESGRWPWQPRREQDVEADL
jgi:uncharacterized membrane protein